MWSTFNGISREHDIKISKEEYQLVFVGRFKRENNVNIVLYKNLTI